MVEIPKYPLLTSSVPVAPLRRSSSGAYTPVTAWLLYADHRVDPIRRSLTLPSGSNVRLPPTPTRSTRSGKNENSASLIIASAIQRLRTQSWQRASYPARAWLEDRLLNGRGKAEKFGRENTGAKLASIWRQIDASMIRRGAWHQFGVRMASD